VLPLTGAGPSAADIEAARELRFVGEHLHLRVCLCLSVSVCGWTKAPSILTLADEKQSEPPTPATSAFGSAQVFACLLECTVPPRELLGAFVYHYYNYALRSYR
jgi:hypothetical protein